MESCAPGERSALERERVEAIERAGGLEGDDLEEISDEAFFARYLVLVGRPAIEAGEAMARMGFKPAEIASAFRLGFIDWERREDEGAPALPLELSAELEPSGS